MDTIIVTVRVYDKRLHRLEDLDLAQNLAIGKDVNKVCYTLTQRLYQSSPITSYI